MYSLWFEAENTKCIVIGLKQIIPICSLWFDLLAACCVFFIEQSSDRAADLRHIVGINHQ
jgi:hypothetical protein